MPDVFTVFLNKDDDEHKKRNKTNQQNIKRLIIYFNSAYLEEENGN